MTNEVDKRDVSRVRVIPEWIFKMLSKRGISGEEYMNLGLVRPYLSTDDMAGWIALNNRGVLFEGISLCVTGSALASAGKYALFDSLPSGQRDITFMDQALGLSMTEEIVKTVVDRLTDSSEEKLTTDDMSSLPYQHVLVGTNLWLVVKKGFSNLVKNPQLRAVFFRDHLKALYKVAPVSTVSNTEIFRMYVGEIAG